MNRKEIAKTGHRSLIGMVTAITLLIAAACASETQDPDATAQDPDATQGPIEIRFGWIPGITGGAIAAIAEDQGLWEKAGLQAELSSFTTGPALVTAMGAGQLDCGYVGIGGLWGPALGLAKIIAVESYGNETFIISQPGSGINDAAGLRGKRVGTPEGTAGDMLLHLALESAGMTDADIQQISMDPPTIVAAFSSGQIDAASIWTPPAEQIRTSVPGAEFILGNPDFADTKFVGAIVASIDSVENNPEAVRRCAQVFIEANDFRLDNKAEAVEITSKFTEIPEATLADAYSNIQFLSSQELDEVQQSGEGAEWFKNALDLTVAVGKLPAAPDVKTYVDFSFFHDAMEPQ